MRDELKLSFRLGRYGKEIQTKPELVGKSIESLDKILQEKYNRSLWDMVGERGLPEPVRVRKHRAHPEQMFFNTPDKATRAMRMARPRRKREI